MQGINASQIFVIEHMIRDELGELVNQYQGGIYLHWSFWHNAEPSTAEGTARILAETHAVVVARAQSQAYKLALYRIDTPEAFARPGAKPPRLARPQTDLDTVLGRARDQLAPNARASTP